MCKETRSRVISFMYRIFLYFADILLMFGETCLSPEFYK